MVFVEIKRALFGKEDSISSSGKQKNPSLLPIVNTQHHANHGAIPTEDPGNPNPETNRAGDISRTNSVISGSSETTLSASMKEGGLVNPRVMSDMIIGLSDGLTVPFALTAGLSSLGDSKLVITGGLAELVSGAISMGLGGYLAAKSEHEYYESQVAKETASYEETPHTTIESLTGTLCEYKVSEETIKSFTDDLEKSPEDMIRFVLQVCKGLEEPETSRQFTSALTIGLAYFFGGFIPLIPYFFVHQVHWGLIISVIVMGVTLFAFGCVKTIVSIGTDCGKFKIISNGVKMVLIGGIAAAAAWGLVRAIE